MEFVGGLVEWTVFLVGRFLEDMTVWSLTIGCKKVYYDKVMRVKFITVNAPTIKIVWGSSVQLPDDPRSLSR